MAVWLLGVASTTTAAQDPQQMVIDTSDAIVKKIKAEREQLKARPELVYDFAEQTILPHFDFDSMSATVVGKHWNTATPEQKTRFTKEFRTLLVRTYSKALIDNIDQKITFLPLRDKAESGDVTVRTEVSQASGFPIPLDYKLHLVDGAWKVYDVVIDKVSMVINFRTSFSKEIRQGSMDKLIEKLSARNQSEAGGTP
jgi:phospholipid transport system substrate-binding protein